MSEYVTVNCIESCPKCRHKIEMKRRNTYWDYTLSRNSYDLDCDYMKNIIINPRTECNGMFEPKEDKK